MSDHRLTRASACHVSCLPIDGCYVHPSFSNPFGFGILCKLSFICDCLALTLTPWFHSVVARGTTQCAQRLCDNTTDWHLTTHPPTMWLSFPPRAKCSWGGSCALRAFGENPIKKRKCLRPAFDVFFVSGRKQRSLCHGCLASKKLLGNLRRFWCQKGQKSFK